MLKYCFDEQNVLKLLRVKTIEPAPITDSFADSPDANLVWKVVIKLTLGNFYLCFIYQPFFRRINTSFTPGHAFLSESLSKI